MFTVLILILCAIAFLVGVFVAFHNRMAGFIVTASAATIALIFTLLASLTQIPTGHAGILVRFGRVESNTTLPNGLHLVDPLTDVVVVNIRQQLREVAKTGSANRSDSLAITKDKVGLSVSVGFPYAINPSLAAQLYQSFGANPDESVIAPAAESALREATARFDWKQIIGEERENFSQTMLFQFQNNVVERLRSAGFSETDAQKAFSYSNLILRTALPPERITAANAEAQAATVDLERQKTLTAIAAQEAQRREQEGIGIQKLFEQLPKGYSTNDILRIMQAVALKTQADAFMRAVEDGKVKVLPLPLAGGPLALNAEENTN